MIGSKKYESLILLLCILVGGCLSPHSFPMDPKTLCEIQRESEKIAARQWAGHIHALLAETLPRSSRKALTSDDLRQADGKITDVYNHFGLNANRIDSLLGNLDGVLTTSKSVAVEEAAPDESWSTGYESVEMPIGDGMTLSAHWRPATGPDLGESYVLITHGLLGKQAGVDQLNISQALRTFGHHVVALDMRGHGQTMVRHPQAPITFGIDEGRDLIAVAHWLQDVRRARRVGLLCFSLTGFEGIMAAWIDSDPNVSHYHPTAIWRHPARAAQSPGL